MALSYHVDIARYACGADAKWIDNLLSRFEVPGTDSTRQGVARRLSTSGIRHVVLTWRLYRDLKLPTGESLSLATRLLSGDTQSVPLSDAVEIRIDRDAFDQAIARAIDDAVESVVPARRGRPARVRGNG